MYIPLKKKKRKEKEGGSRKGKTAEDSSCLPGLCRSWCPRGRGVRAARFSLGRRARALRRKETEASRRRSKLPGFQTWLCDLLAGRPWPRGSAFASLRFPGDEAEATTDVERPQKTARARGETPTAPAVRVRVAVSRPTALGSLAAAWRGFGAGSGGVVKFLAPPWGRCNPTFRMTDQSRCAPPRSELPGSAGGLRTWYLLL